VCSNKAGCKNILTENTNKTLNLRLATSTIHKASPDIYVAVLLKFIYNSVMKNDHELRQTFHGHAGTLGRLILCDIFMSSNRPHFWEVPLVMMGSRTTNNSAATRDRVCQITCVSMTSPCSLNRSKSF